MAIIITSDTLVNAGLSEQDFLIDLACYMYEKKRLSMGKAREIAGLNLMEFQAELAAREIDLHYSEEDLDKDLKNLGLEL